MPPLWLRLLVVAASGAFGAVARWCTSKLTQAWLGSAWPYGTLAVNVIGCFIFGWAFEAFRDDAQESTRRLIWLSGFCGAFTTFSTFAFDVVELHVGRGPGYAALNVALHVVLGLAAVFVGQAIGRSWS